MFISAEKRAKEPLSTNLSRGSPWLGPSAVAFTALLFLLVNPVGFVGGGNDDQHYLTAARCWVDTGGACLPQNHWGARWPIVAPIAATLALFGDNRDALGVAPLAAWIAALVLFGLLCRMWIDRATGLLAAGLFAAVPAFTLTALQPNIDNVELALQLAALCLATVAYQRDAKLLALAAGLFLAVACQARETSFVLSLVLAGGGFFLFAKKRHLLLYILTGFAVGIGAEVLVYAFETGDPLFRYRLALGHGAVPSAELASTVDTGRSAMFNPEFIAGWRREMGIELWWPVDPWLNLITSPRLGTTLIGAAILVGLMWNKIPDDWHSRIKLIAAHAILLAFLLVYALAVDPKTRMFLLPAAAATLCLAAALVTAWRTSQRLTVLVTITVMAVIGAMTLKTKTDPRPFERAAKAWIASKGDRVEIDEPTRTALALVPGAAELPPKGSGKPLRISIGLNGCSRLVQPKDGQPPLAQILDEVGASSREQLCLLEYSRASGVPASAQVKNP